ncbi:MAG: hypothetical protein IPM56_01380 [Ignavibacteriales bacterium]|nr:MAG: hypothetical protein IPM56_01380 [Ignavibacteriales bacterium]
MNDFYEDVLWQDAGISISGFFDPMGQFTVTAQNSNVTSLISTSGVDITTLLGITRVSTGSTSTTGLRATDPDAVLSAASNLTAVTNNVKSALGRIGNLSQIVESRTEFLTSSIANNNSAISKLFDADMALEQLKATKGSLGVQIGTSMLAQVNIAPQQLLTLFR